MSDKQTTQQPEKSADRGQVQALVMRSTAGLLPRRWNFACLNELAHHPDSTFEDLQSVLLGAGSEIDRLAEAIHPTSMEELIAELTVDEGSSVELLSENPELSGPKRAIECCGGWTGWEQKRFTGENLLICLEIAAAERRMM